jgi:hypothetical protein
MEEAGTAGASVGAAAVFPAQVASFAATRPGEVAFACQEHWDQFYLQQQK